MVESGTEAVLETPGPDKRGTTAEEIAYAKRLRRAGLKARA